jgi:glucose/arabinose dehydrogenase
MFDSSISPSLKIIARDLEIPWSIEFSPEGLLYFTERVGRLNVIVDGKIRNLLKIDVEAREGNESGLLGLALSPNYLKSKQIYVYYTYRDATGVWNRISYFTEEGEKLVDEDVILDKIPGGSVHDGGRMKFGPDGILYATTGETWRKELAQDLESLGGKILRLNPDGTLPEDNPFPGSPVYSYGNRNSQGLAWHPKTSELYATEHGPSGENGWYAHDEINIIEPGGNYGWPHIIGAGYDPRFIDPIYHTGDETWAPSGCSFYSGKRYPNWDGKLLVANLRGKHMRVISLKSPEYRILVSNVSVYQNELGRLRTVVQGWDDYVYLCTSNRDGRGIPSAGDDKIVKILEEPKVS